MTYRYIPHPALLYPWLGYWYFDLAQGGWEGQQIFVTWYKLETWLAREAVASRRAAYSVIIPRLLQNGFYLEEPTDRDGYILRSTWYGLI